MCSTRFPFSHIIYIAILIFNITFSIGVVALKHNGGAECSLHTTNGSESFPVVFEHVGLCLVDIHCLVVPNVLQVDGA